MQNQDCDGATDENSDTLWFDDGTQDPSRCDGAGTCQAGVCDSGATACTSDDTYVVPVGCTSMTVRAWGASGGTGHVLVGTPGKGGGGGGSGACLGDLSADGVGRIPANSGTAAGLGEGGDESGDCAANDGTSGFVTIACS